MKQLITAVVIGLLVVLLYLTNRRTCRHRGRRYSKSSLVSPVCPLRNFRTQLSAVGCIGRLWRGISVYANPFPSTPFQRFLSTGETRELAPVNWGSASTLGLSLHPRTLSFPTGETARCAKTCGMWRIRATVAVGAAVKSIGVGIWYADGMAPRKGGFPTGSPPAST